MPACAVRSARSPPTPSPRLSTRPPACRPVDRVISSYEFAVDIAAKGVMHLGPPRRPSTATRKPDFVGTLDVWPWSILIPWFKFDMAARVRRGEGTGRQGRWGCRGMQLAAG